MPNPYFQFKQFTIWHNKCAMKVGTDGVLLGSWANVNDVTSVLDIGTGTGLLAVMLAQRIDTVIDAVEIDKEAYLQACENVGMCPWAGRIHVFNVPFQDYSKNTAKKYDLVVSNPPYFNNSLKAPDSKRSLARHSDSLSYGELLEGVASLLSDNGRFCVILPYPEAQLFIVDAAINHLYVQFKLNVKPKFHSRVNRVLIQFSKTRSKVMEDSISILNVNSEYSDEYRLLTKDYYLKF